MDESGPWIEHLDFEVQCNMCDPDSRTQPHRADFFIQFSCGCEGWICVFEYWAVEMITQKMRIVCKQCGESCYVVRGLSI